MRLTAVRGGPVYTTRQSMAAFQQDAELLEDPNFKTFLTAAIQAAQPLRCNDIYTPLTKALMNSPSQQLCVLEVGVMTGDAVVHLEEKILAGGKSVSFVMYDSFEGFSQEDPSWGGKNPFGDTAPYLAWPKSDAIICKGFITSECDHKFELLKGKRVDYIHMDVDTYQSTLDSLNNLCQVIDVTQPLFLFDDSIMPVGLHSEFKAIYDFCQLKGLRLKFIGAGPHPNLWFKGLRRRSLLGSLAQGLFSCAHSYRYTTMVEAALKQHLSPDAIKAISTRQMANILVKFESR